MRAEFSQTKMDELERQESGIPMPDIKLSDDYALVKYLDSCWEDAKRAKEAHAEPQILLNMRQVDGAYDVAKLSAIRQVGGSEVFMMITDAKCKNAVNWTEELLFQPNQSPFDVSPTPVPELPDYVMQDMYQEVFAEIIQTIQQETQASGEQMTPEMVYGKLEQILPEVKEKVKDIVYEKALGLSEAISQEIDDKLVEGGWYSALKTCLPNIIMHTGFLTGPIPRKRRSIKISPMADGKLNAEITESIIPTFESRHPLNIYPSPDSTDINDGYLFDRIKLTPMMLQELLDVPSYDNDEIKLVLEEIKEGKLDNWLSVDQEKADINDTPSPLFYDSKKIEGLKFMGAVRGSDILEWGRSKGPDGKKLEKDLYYNIIAYKIGRHVISVQFNKDPLGRKPYYKSSFEGVDGSFWGKGLPQIIKDVQGVCNAMARAIVNNAGMASGPQVERNIDRIPSAERADNKLIPWKVWDVTSDMMAGAAPALKFYQPPMVVERLMSVYDKFSKIADEHSGVPAFAHGDSNVGGAGNTASGLSMLMGSAARGIKSIIKSIDEFIIKPSVERQYIWLIERKDYFGMVCDYQIVSGGIMAALAREQMAARRIEFMNSTANPIDVQIMGMEGRKYVLEETAKSVNMDLTRYIPKKAPPMPPPQEGEKGPFGPTGAGAQQLDEAGAPVAGQDTRMFNEATAVQGRADGGPVSSGQPYVVGENGPEVMVPGPGGGEVIPNQQVHDIVDGWGDHITPGEKPRIWARLPIDDRAEDIMQIVTGQRSFGPKKDAAIDEVYKSSGNNFVKTAEMFTELMEAGTLPHIMMYKSDSNKPSKK